MEKETELKDIVKLAKEVGATRERNIIMDKILKADLPFEICKQIMDIINLPLNERRGE